MGLMRRRAAVQWYVNFFFQVDYSILYSLPLQRKTTFLVKGLRTPYVILDDEQTLMVVLCLIRLRLLLAPTLRPLVIHICDRWGVFLLYDSRCGSDVYPAIHLTRHTGV